MGVTNPTVGPARPFVLPKSFRRALPIALLVAYLPISAIGATFTVNSTSDATDWNWGDGQCDDGNGNCTLRGAIEEANALPGQDAIGFSIGPATIRPLFALPFILSAVTIDGRSAPGYVGVPLIEIDGSLTPGGTDGFEIYVGPCTVRGLVINRFRHAVFVRASACTVTACYIGTDINGTAAAPNAGAGIRIQDAGDTQVTGNVISGNATEGVLLLNYLTSNTITTLIADNIIGLDAFGNAAIPNSTYGVLFSAITGGGQPSASESRVDNNVISGNGVSGVAAIGSSGNLIVNNYVGTDRTGLLGRGNGVDGVVVQDGSGNIIRNNVISANQRNGVTIENVTPPSVPPGASVASSVITAGGAASSEYRVAEGQDVVEEATVLDEASMSPEGRPRASLNGSATGNIVDANLIGTDKLGTGDLGNVAHGVRLSRVGTEVLGASGNTVGGQVTMGGCSGPCNVIAGNHGNGVHISQGATGNLVRGNYIGVRKPGSSTLGNWGNGVHVSDAGGNSIGGSQAGLGNLIGGNANGVALSGGPSSGSTGGANQNQVRGNGIGTDFAGTTVLANSQTGVLVATDPGGATCNENDIGRDPAVTPTGTCTAGCNRIHYNGAYGIRIIGEGSTNTHVYGNIVSGNSSHGVFLAASGTIVGGSSADLGNVIANNSGSGVYVLDGLRNQIRNNPIRANAFLGIDLVGSDRPTTGPQHGRRITPNDPLDADLGPNSLQNFPILTEAIPNAGTTTVKGYLRSAPNASYVVDFYLCDVADPSHFGEAESVVDYVAAFTTDATGYSAFEADLPLDIPSTTFITATATDALGNTSEFSQALATVDTDDDAILDIWETAGWGIDVNSDGVIDLDLQLDGADVNHKDVYVEVDAMAERVPFSNALPLVEQAFSRAPNSFVENPDGQPGIRLVARLSDTNLELWDWSLAADYWVEFFEVKGNYFGNDADRLSPNRAHILDAKRLVYRYCLFADVITQSGMHPLGVAEQGPSNDFLVTHGRLRPEKNTAFEQAETFMHELGHTLGLKDGGGDGVNYQPNHLSVMNYAWGYSGTWSDQFADGFFGSRSLTYGFSRDGLPDLTEDALDEFVGLGVPSTHPTGEPGFPITMVPFSDQDGDIDLARVRPNQGVDWRRDGIPSPLVSVNINNLRGNSPAGETLRGDLGGWHTLQYNFRAGPWIDPPPPGPFAQVARTTSVMDEPTVELIEMLDAIPPPRPTGHFEMDGVIDSVPELAHQGGLSLHGAYIDGQLYVATSSAASVSGDVFVLVAEQQGTLVGAPGGHGGQVGQWLAVLSNTPNGVAAWSNASQVPIGGISVDSSATIVEGVVDIELLLGREPVGLLIAVGNYDPASGGTLLAQVPSGNGDGNIDPWEFYRLLPAPPTHWPAAGEGNVPICLAVGSQEFPEITSDGRGGAFMAWFDYRASAIDIYAQHVLPTGAIDPAWPIDGRAIARAYNDLSYQHGAESLMLIGDGRGGAFLAWEDGRSGNGVTIFAQHLLTSGADPLWPVNGSSVVASGSDACSNPTIVASGTGSVIVTWVQSGGSNGVRAQRLLSNGAADPTWPAGGLVVRNAPYASSHRLTIASDGSDGAIVGWNVANNGIWAHHLLVSGVLDPAWPAAGTVLCAAGGYQEDPAMVSDGSGGAIVAWGDGRNFPSPPYAQHVLATGLVDPAWPLDGIALSSIPWWNSARDNIDIVTDGAGGALVTWSAGFFATDVYVQRVLWGGALDPAWPADGRAVRLGNFTQDPSPVIATDALGGAFVAWNDGNDIYVQHVFHGGAIDPGWPAEGRALYSDPWNQITPAIAADGGRGAIVTWRDPRNYSEPLNFSDIYAQRVDSDGVLGGVVVAEVPSRGGPPTLSLEPVHPNPTRSGAIRVRFTLTTSSPATLEMIDLAGRRIAARDVGSLGVGRHSVDFGVGRHIPPGVYFARLKQGTVTKSVRVVVID